MHKITHVTLKMEMPTHVPLFVSYRNFNYKKMKTLPLLLPNVFVQHFFKYLIEATSSYNVLFKE